MTDQYKFKIKHYTKVGTPNNVQFRIFSIFIDIDRQRVKNIFYRKTHSTNNY